MAFQDTREEEIAHNLILIKEYKRTLWKLEEQAAKFGSHAPPHIQAEIDLIRERISGYENNIKLRRNTDLHKHAKGKQTILIIDDDPLLVSTLKETLLDEGYDVITATDGLDGVRIANEKVPDLILLDIRMPLMTGEEVLRKIIERKIPTRVIMCTNYGDRKSIVKFIKLGACNYISKPFDNDDLVYTVKYSLELDSIIK